jgi:ABC-2 type transport system permease protein
MFTIFRNAFSRYRGQILGWGISLGLLCLYMARFYNTIASQKEAYLEMVESFPKELMAFFSSEASEMFTPSGFLNIEFFSYMPIIIGIFAILAGSGMLAGDEENGTMDLILAHPVSRTELFMSRILAFLVATIGILVLNWIGFLIGIPGSGLDLNALEIGRPFISLFAQLMLYGMLALVLSMLLPSRRMAAMTSGILMVASFFITALARLDENLETVAKISPMNYYQGGMAIDGLKWGWVAGLLGISALFILIAWWRFERRDIRVGGEGGWRLTGFLRLRKRQEVAENGRWKKFSWRTTRRIGTTSNGKEATMFTIFRNALTRYRGQILGWGLSLAALSLLMTSFYDTIAAQKDQYMKILENYPKEMLAFLGTSDAMDMFTPAGYLNIENFSYMTIIIGIFIILAGSSMLAGDEETGTLDLVLGHPVSRTALFAGRFLAFLVATIGILVLNWIGFLIGIPGSGLGLNAFEIARPFISLFAVLVLFGTLALVLSMLLPSRRMAAMIAGIVMVASFFITALAQMDVNLEKVAKISPMNYYQGGLAINGVKWGWVAGLLGISLLFVLIAWWRFERRDIRVGGEGGWRLPEILRLRKKQVVAGNSV